MARPERRARYDALAPVYDRLHERFLRLAGGAAQSAFEGAATALLRPDTDVLDAGCGTGRHVRHLLAAEPTIRATLLDASPTMLRRTRDLPVRRVHGSLEALPFPDASFDLALSAWAIETVEDAAAAISELVRVVRFGGHVLLCFCAESPAADPLDRFVMRAVRMRGTGRFLDAEALLAPLRVRAGLRVRRLSAAGPAASVLIDKSDERRHGLGGTVA